MQSSLTLYGGFTATRVVGSIQSNYRHKPKNIRTKPTTKLNSTTQTQNTFKSFEKQGSPWKIIDEEDFLASLFLDKRPGGLSPNLSSNPMSFPHIHASNLSDLQKITKGLGFSGINLHDLSSMSLPCTLDYVTNLLSSQSSFFSDGDEDQTANINSRDRQLISLHTMMSEGRHLQGMELYRTIRSLSPSFSHAHTLATLLGALKYTQSHPAEPSSRRATFAMQGREIPDPIYYSPPSHIGSIIYHLTLTHIHDAMSSHALTRLCPDVIEIAFRGLTAHASGFQMEALLVAYLRVRAKIIIRVLLQSPWEVREEYIRAIISARAGSFLEKNEIEECIQALITEPEIIVEQKDKKRDQDTKKLTRPKNTQQSVSDGLQRAQQLLLAIFLSEASMASNPDSGIFPFLPALSLKKDAPAFVSSHGTGTTDVDEQMGIPTRPFLPLPNFPDFLEYYSMDPTTVRELEANITELCRKDTQAAYHLSSTPSLPSPDTRLPRDAFYLLASQFLSDGVSSRTEIWTNVAILNAAESTADTTMLFESQGWASLRLRAATRRLETLSHFSATPLRAGTAVDDPSWMSFVPFPSLIASPPSGLSISNRRQVLISCVVAGRDAFATVVRTNSSTSSSLSMQDISTYIRLLVSAITPADFLASALRAPVHRATLAQRMHNTRLKLSEEQDPKCTLEALLTSIPEAATNEWLTMEHQEAEVLLDAAVRLWFYALQTMGPVPVDVSVAVVEACLRAGKSSLAKILVDALLSPTQTPMDIEGRMTDSTMDSTTFMDPVTSVLSTSGTFLSFLLPHEVLRFTNTFLGQTEVLGESTKFENSLFHSMSEHVFSSAVEASLFHSLLRNSTIGTFSSKTLAMMAKDPTINPFVETSGNLSQLPPTPGSSSPPPSPFLSFSSRAAIPRQASRLSSLGISPSILYSASVSDTRNDTKNGIVGQDQGHEQGYEQGPEHGKPCAVALYNLLITDSLQRRDFDSVWGLFNLCISTSPTVFTDPNLSSSTFSSFFSNVIYAITAEALIEGISTAPTSSTLTLGWEDIVRSRSSFPPELESLISTTSTTLLSTVPGMTFQGSLATARLRVLLPLIFSRRTDIELQPMVLISAMAMGALCGDVALVKRAVAASVHENYILLVAPYALTLVPMAHRMFLNRLALPLESHALARAQVAEITLYAEFFLPTRARASFNNHAFLDGMDSGSEKEVLREGNIQADMVAGDVRGLRRRAVRHTTTEPATGMGTEDLLVAGFSKLSSARAMNSGLSASTSYILDADTSRFSVPLSTDLQSLLRPTSSSFVSKHEGLKENNVDSGTYNLKNKKEEMLDHTMERGSIHSASLSADFREDTEEAVHSDRYQSLSRLERERLRQALRGFTSLESPFASAGLLEEGVMTTTNTTLGMTSSINLTNPTSLTAAIAGCVRMCTADTMVLTSALTLVLHRRIFAKKGTLGSAISPSLLSAVSALCPTVSPLSVILSVADIARSQLQSISATISPTATSLLSVAEHEENSEKAIVTAAVTVNRLLRRLQMDFAEQEADLRRAYENTARDAALLISNEDYDDVITGQNRVEKAVARAKSELDVHARGSKHCTLGTADSTAARIGAIEALAPTVFSSLSSASAALAAFPLALASLLERMEFYHFIASFPPEAPEVARKEFLLTSAWDSGAHARLRYVIRHRPLSASSLFARNNSFGDPTIALELSRSGMGFVRELLHTTAYPSRAMRDLVAKHLTMALGAVLNAVENRPEGLWVRDFFAVSMQASIRASDLQSIKLCAQHRTWTRLSTYSPRTFHPVTGRFDTTFDPFTPATGSLKYGQIPGFDDPVPPFSPVPVTNGFLSSLLVAFEQTLSPLQEIEPVSSRTCTSQERLEKFLDEQEATLGIRTPTEEEITRLVSKIGSSLSLSNANLPSYMSVLETTSWAEMGRKTNARLARLGTIEPLALSYLRSLEHFAMFYDVDESGKTEENSEDSYSDAFSNYTQTIRQAQNQATHLCRMFEYNGVFSSATSLIPDDYVSAVQKKVQESQSASASVTTTVHRKKSSFFSRPSRIPTSSHLDDASHSQLHAYTPSVYSYLSALEAVERENLHQVETELVVRTKEAWLMARRGELLFPPIMFALIELLKTLENITPEQLFKAFYHNQ